MAQKKTIIFIIGIIVIFAIVVLSLLSANQKLKTENAVLQKEGRSLAKKNESLAAQLTQEQREKRELKERLAQAERELERALDRYQREKDEWQKRYEILAKERNDLADKLSKAKAPEVVQPRPQAPSVQPALSDDLYWAGVLKEKTNLEIQVANLKDELKATKIKLEGINKVKEALESEIKNLKELDIKNLTMEKQELERRIGYNERLIDSLSLELVREKKDNRKLKEDYKILLTETENLKKEVRTLTNEVDKLNEHKVALEDKLQKTELAKSDLERRMIEMNSVLDEKVNEIIDMKQRLELIKQEKGLIPSQRPPVPLEKPPVPSPSPKGPESSVVLPPIVVRPPEVDIPANDVGKILEINSSNRFVIIDAGDEQGVKPGMKLSVYRDNKRIAALEVIQTRKNVSAADIKQIIQPIRVGDSVRY